MEFIDEKRIDGDELTIELDRANVDGIKVAVSGELAAESADRRFLLQLNYRPGINHFYQSFVVMDGHAGMGEWDGRGFYVGRNGWGLDASVSIEYTISAAMLNMKRLGHGMATFAHGNNTILGYTCNGFVVSDEPIRSVSLLTNGGHFKGKMRLYAI